MEILGQLLDLCKEQNIEFTDLGSFCCIQRKNNTSEDRSKTEDDTKIKEGIDLLTRREPEVMKFLVCWTCKEFGHFSSKCPKRLRKSRRNFLSNKDEEFLNDCDKIKKKEVVEEIALVTIIDLEANHESVEVIIDNDLHNNVKTKEIRGEESVVPKIRVEGETPTPNKNMMRNHMANQIIGSK